jgi:hypothetical protein
MLFSLWALTVLATAPFNTARAHGGTQPEHGGVVQLVGDMSFELVARPEGVELYVEDDGDEVNSADLAAKLTIVSAGAKSHVMLLLTLKDKQSKIAANFAIK